METSRDETQDIAVLVNPTGNSSGTTERKNRESIRTKNIEKSEKEMKLPSAAQNKAMVLLSSPLDRLSMVKLPREV